MTNFFVNGNLSDADLTAIETKVSEIKALLPFLINLQPKQRRTLRKRGTKRTGYVDEMYGAALTHPEIIPATYDLGPLKNRKLLADQLFQLLSLVGSLSEGINDTLLGLGVDLMHHSDSCYAYLQEAAKNNAALTDLLNKISATFQGQGKKKVPSPPGP